MKVLKFLMRGRGKLITRHIYHVLPREASKKWIEYFECMMSILSSICVMWGNAFLLKMCTCYLMMLGCSGEVISTSFLCAVSEEMTSFLHLALLGIFRCCIRVEILLPIVIVWLSKLRSLASSQFWACCWFVTASMMVWKRVSITVTIVFDSWPLLEDLFCGCMAIDWITPL